MISVGFVRLFARECPVRRSQAAMSCLGGNGEGVRPEIRTGSLGLRVPELALSGSEKAGIAHGFYGDFCSR